MDPTYLWKRLISHESLSHIYIVFKHSGEWWRAMKNFNWRSEAHCVKNTSISLRCCSKPATLSLAEWSFERALIKHHLMENLSPIYSLKGDTAAKHIWMYVQPSWDCHIMIIHESNAKTCCEKMNMFLSKKMKSILFYYDSILGLFESHCYSLCTLVFLQPSTRVYAMNIKSSDVISYTKETPRLCPQELVTNSASLEVKSIKHKRGEQIPIKWLLSLHVPGVKPADHGEVVVYLSMDKALLKCCHMYLWVGRNFWCG